MLDDTIKRNVAFGCSDEEIEEEKVWKALEEAELDEFVKRLPKGLDTSIGERVQLKLFRHFHNNLLA